MARESELVDQSSGVSARVPISALELLVSNLERRALVDRRRASSTRASATCRCSLPAITGKVEMVYEGEQQGAEIVARKLIGEAVKKVFESKFPPVEGPRSRSERPAPPRAADCRGRRERADDARAAEAAGTAPPRPPPGPYDAIVGGVHGRRRRSSSRTRPVLRASKTLECVPGPVGLRPQACEAARPLRARVPHGARPRGPRPEPPHRARGPRLDAHVRRAREVQSDAQPGVAQAQALLAKASGREVAPYRSGPPGATISIVRGG